MVAPDEPDYALLDRLGAAGQIFFPQPDRVPAPAGAEDLAIEVAPGVEVAARFYTSDPRAATILYFHGNGEVASDHDAIAPLYHGAGANLLVAEFRGYGRSGGRPSFAALVSDAHAVAHSFHALLDERGASERRFIMGRSLGSQPALELAARAAERFRGVIIESGAGSVRRMLARFGIDAATGDGAALAAAHEAKVRSIRLPALLIHGEADDLVPLDYAAELYDLLEGTSRDIVVIAGAGHNDILWRGRERYFEAIARFIEE